MRRKSGFFLTPSNSTVPVLDVINFTASGRSDGFSLMKSGESYVATYIL